MASSNGTTKNDDTMLAFGIPSDGSGAGGQLMTIPRPTLTNAGDALIRVLRAGVCNTDLEILKGYMGFKGVLGHEFVGIVESFHPSTPKEQQDKWIGKRVCGDINVGCHQSTCIVCKNLTCLNTTCSKMSRNHCPNRTVLGILMKDGTMAEYISLPTRNLHLVPDHISDEVAVFAEPLAAACRIIEQGLVRYEFSETSPPDKVAILGDGKLGLMIAEVLGREHVNHFESSTSFDRPLLIGKHMHKMELVANVVDCKLVQECQDSASFSGIHKDYDSKFDVVVDATGNPNGMALAAGLCRPMGTLVLKSTCATSGQEQFNAAPFVIDELKVIGSRCGPIDVALDLLAVATNTGKQASCTCLPLGVEKYITKAFPLSEAKEAIACAKEKSTMKVQIICSER